MHRPFPLLLLLTLVAMAQAQHLVTLALGPPTEDLDLDDGMLYTEAEIFRRATCSAGQSVCDDGCIPGGANCCRYGNNAYCDADEYCTSDDMCCPLGKACPGPGKCKDGFDRCGSGCIPEGFVCCTGWYCKSKLEPNKQGRMVLIKWTQNR
jgi:hypothetical protein